MGDSGFFSNHGGVEAAGLIGAWRRYLVVLRRDRSRLWLLVLGRRRLPVLGLLREGRRILKATVLLVAFWLPSGNSDHLHVRRVSSTRRLADISIGKATARFVVTRSRWNGLSRYQPLAGFKPGWPEQSWRALSWGYEHR
ncbi:hypothetical protein Taro_053734 [Colocasia esculenta]|uniref:Uncharacterized protein n=1 Tax=Colocasia esculenta TaxID=4460 RepID=A0A843XP37_COLES|nr:hypothetical protein [Colocasia esculenta]